jgi:SAM-dependent methyltransferase
MPSGQSDLSLEEALRGQLRSWEERPLLRLLYRRWFREIRARLSPVTGRSVELGAGIGRLQEVAPEVAATDVVATPWTDEVVDAEGLPFADATLANLVLVDVFHHLARPARFLSEAARALAPGGRIVVLDPYCSPLSSVAYRLFHHERTDLGAEAFEDDPSIAGHPLDSNQARATLAFFRRRDELERRWPELEVVERKLLAFLAYPLSGGFTGRKLVPNAVGRALLRAEPALRPVSRLIAFRCLVVLERRGGSGT